MYVPGTSGAPESVNGSKYTVCEAASDGADMVRFAILLARDIIDAVDCVVNNGKKWYRYPAMWC
jgi:hypothetical protein